LGITKQKQNIMNFEIDYLFNGCTGAVAFIIKGNHLNGKYFSYKSPFVFETTEDAYHAAVIELSNK